MVAQIAPWRVAWWLTLLTIPLLSLFGRGLQGDVLSLLSRNTAAWLVFFALLGFTFSGLRWLHARTPHWMWHLVWLVLLFVLLPFTLNNFEERIHFLLFGAFGFITMRLYSPAAALMWVYSLAGGDELLQWWLPQRVGDWHDVYINLLAGSGGVLLAYVGKRRG